MNDHITPELTHEFLSSARVFAKSVRDVFEAAVLREVAGNKLTFGQLKLLYLVAQTDSVTIGDAAAFLGVTSPAASKTVEKLVQRDLLRRGDIQGDRRASQISLTETSQRLLETYEAARNQRAAAVFAQHSAAELRRTSEFLDRLAAGISSQGVDPRADQDQICLQCEIYFREQCRFGKIAGRNCFYQRYKKGPPDLLVSKVNNTNPELINSFDHTKAKED